MGHLLAIFIFVSASGDATRFRPSPTPDGGFNVPTAAPLFPLQYTAGATLSYAKNPVIWRYDDGTYDPVIANQLTMDVGLAIGLLPLVELGAVMPVILTQNGPKGSLTGLDAVTVNNIGGTHLGDLRLVPKIAMVMERSYGVGLSFVPEVTIPTGDDQRFIGDDGLAFRPKLVLTVPLKVLPLRITANAGYRWRVNSDVAGLTLGDELEVGSSVEFFLKDVGVPLSLIAEVNGATSARHPFEGGALAGLEAIAGARARVLGDLVTTAGIAVGLAPGVGTPDYRLILGVAYAPMPPDRDGDGIPDLADDCPDTPEDYDRFADIDGCPEPDNDEDGILDKVDRCPDIPEDENGIKDDDGCPDEGVYDKDDDGIQDADDACPDNPEDIDDYEDKDGCPEPDNDGDGVLDEQDKCPGDKETINGIDDWDGCPDEGEGQTEYIENVKIGIKATILFETSRSTIKDESKSLLNQVALQILSHPEIKKVRIEGHTDSVGPEEDNLYLSQDRADSVRRYLVSRGIDKKRLEAVGYGETRPIDTNNTPTGRGRNRRVDFVIVQE